METVPSVISPDSMEVPRVVWSAPPESVRPVPVKSVMVSLFTLIPEVKVCSSAKVFAVYVFGMVVDALMYVFTAVLSRILVTQ